MIVQLVARRRFDFSATSAAACDVVLARHLDVLAFRSAVLLVRVHAKTMSGTTLDVMSFRSSPSSDEPDSDFTQTTSLATAKVDTAAAGTLIRKALTAKFGSHLRVILRATPAASPSTFTATLSVALVLLEDP